MNIDPLCGEPRVVTIPSTSVQYSGMETILVMLYGLLAIFSLLRLVIPSLAEQDRRKRDTEDEGWQPVLNIPDTDDHYSDKITATTTRYGYKKTTQNCIRPVIIIVNSMDSSDILHTIMEGIPAFIHHV